jgi:hypothetical protein
MRFEELSALCLFSKQRIDEIPGTELPQIVYLFTNPDVTDGDL